MGQVEEIFLFSAEEQCEFKHKIIDGIQQEKVGVKSDFEYWVQTMELSDMKDAKINKEGVMDQEC